PSPAHMNNRISDTASRIWSWAAPESHGRKIPFLMSVLTCPDRNTHNNSRNCTHPGSLPPCRLPLPHVSAQIGQGTGLPNFLPVLHFPRRLPGCFRCCFLPAVENKTLYPVSGTENLS